MKDKKYAIAEKSILDPNIVWYLDDTDSWVCNAEHAITFYSETETIVHKDWVTPNMVMEIKEEF